MTSNDRSEKKSKISPGLASQLEHLKPGKKVRVIVLLCTPHGGKGRRQSSAERDAAVEAMKESARSALSEVDAILERTDGQRLAGSPDAFGAVPVKGTAAAIYALARSKKVKAIMEDQAIHLTY